MFDPIPKIKSTYMEVIEETLATIKKIRRKYHSLFKKHPDLFFKKIAEVVLEYNNTFKAND